MNSEAFSIVGAWMTPLASGRSYRRAGSSLVSVIALAALAACGGSDDDDGQPPPTATAPTVQVLSSKPELVSGGDALVGVTLGDPADTLQVTLNGTDVSGAFLADPANSNRRIGLVSGIVNGANTLVAAAAGASTNLSLTGYPLTGPMISGPHENPYICTTETFNLPDGTTLGAPLDANCSVQRRVHYVYRSSATPGNFVPLPDPMVRPADLASVTNNVGRTVNYIVRVETGTINRAIYQSAILHDPVADPTPAPTAPPAGWNRKVIYPLGGGCQGGWYTQGTTTVSPLNDGYLRAGYGVLTATLNTFGNNCNDLLSSETILMVKERFIESYGVPAFTIGTGSSGGAYQSNQTSDNYPGTFDGIVTTNSFPDVTTGMVSLGDSRLLDVFFNVTRPGEYTEEQQKAISGYLQVNNIAFLSGRTINSGSARRMDPRVAFPGVFPAELRYDPVTNPTGARGSVYDHTVNVYGRIAGTPGAGFAQRPLDNVGVQYGLKAYNDGVISFDEFVELNTLIGGFDIDLNHIPSRTVAYPDAVRRAYQGGRILGAGNGMADIPVITRLAAGDQVANGDIHLRYWAHAIRARLIKANGNADNQVIVGHLYPVNQLIEQMDRWLTAIDDDTSDISAAAKVVKNKPADVVDACWTAGGDKIVETQTLSGPGQCNTLFPAGTSAALVAGAPLALDIIKCQLKPISAADYAAPLTAAQLVRLNIAFPHGVCDWSKPGVEQVPGIPWASFGPSPTNLVFDVTAP
jgi:hypothetical protein